MLMLTSNLSLFFVPVAAIATILDTDEFDRTLLAAGPDEDDDDEDENDLAEDDEDDDEDEDEADE